MGFVYFGIGAVLIIVHDRQMAKRTRAGRNEIICFHRALSATVSHAPKIPSNAKH
jgi:hypothetical protein